MELLVTAQIRFTLTTESFTPRTHLIYPFASSVTLVLIREPKIQGWSVFIEGAEAASGFGV